MTWVATTSPTRLAAAAPASTALRTAATSPRTIAVTRPASIFSQPTRRTLAAFTIASAASIIATSPRHSTIPSASGMTVSRHRLTRIFESVSQGVNRRGNVTTTTNKLGRRKSTHLHDRPTAEQTTKLHHVADVASRHRNDSHRGCLVIHDAD